MQVFLKITQTQSITKAAEELHLTQPAVSIQLKNLQDQFEVPLTEVVGRRIFITDFGKEIAAGAEKIVNEVHAINNRTLAYKGQLTGRLKITAVSTGKYVMPYFLSEFLKQHRGVELVLDVTNKARVIESLEKNEVDFSLVSVLPENLQVENIELMENKLYLVGNKAQEFNRKLHDNSILEDLPLIYREPGSGTRHVMEKFIKQNNLPVVKKMELTSNEAVKQAVIAGLGYSIMPLIGVKNELNNGDLQIIPVQGFPIKSTWNLIWLKGKSFSPVAKAYLNYLQKDKDKTIQEWFSWLSQF
ncbi:DNA-binding transcriptional LysR family regulator [Pontibacter ummariensis]|uniref:DNA-binding transcriptional regulator, LysR family n=1 Tax=Pontibacter ummariensis TaxID=1610492 RepID=A0A239GP39_9BACT|nr:DNA-binding transcriptional LysR family regulator [Pontibacter ummariensis]SNS70969.1 DNA-binding transcriptional regulator, LysR family [Pontibacter ummariensis]